MRTHFTSFPRRNAEPDWALHMHTPSLSLTDAMATILQSLTLAHTSPPQEMSPLQQELLDAGYQRLQAQRQGHGSLSPTALWDLLMLTTPASRPPLQPYPYTLQNALLDTMSQRPAPLSQTPERTLALEDALHRLQLAARIMDFYEQAIPAVLQRQTSLYPLWDAASAAVEQWPSTPDTATPIHQANFRQAADVMADAFLQRRLDSVAVTFMLHHIQHEGVTLLESFCALDTLQPATDIRTALFRTLQHAQQTSQSNAAQTDDSLLSLTQASLQQLALCARR